MTSVLLQDHMRLSYDPVIDAVTLTGFLITLGVILIISAILNKRLPYARAVTGLVLLILLINPVVVFEKREAMPDVVFAVLDESLSQNIGERQERAEKALAYLQSKLGQRKDIDFRVLRVQGKDETNLFESVHQAVADIPEKRRGGVFLITDGQVHDAPEAQKLSASIDAGPVHALLTGEKGERDRQIKITQAPAYGIVGKDVEAKFRVEDSEDKSFSGTEATITIRRANEPDETRTVRVNEENSLTLPLKQAGENIVEISVSPLEDELSPGNNKTILIVNGVRERLRVLLVSGEPSASTQTWREMLKADPGVDLVHFTILREPTSFDMTPQREMALIPFPFQQLFEEKLDNFNLIIFDHFKLNNLLPMQYFANITNYVRRGGGFLEVSGPSYSAENSIYNTDLQDILPGEPNGPPMTGPIMPTLTQDGKDHPVTSQLPQKWGHWLRYMPVTPKDGTLTLMTAGDAPLLLLRRIEQGRVAQLTTDQIWLWRRGYEGGGPAAELLRKIAHWIMKEPDLEEETLNARLINDRIQIRQRHWKNTDDMSVSVTTPDNKTETIAMTTGEDKWSEGWYTPASFGVYKFQTGGDGRVKYVVYGDAATRELNDLRTTEQKLTPIIKHSKGGIVWLAESAEPALRDLQRNRDYKGWNWLGIRRNQDYQIAGVETKPVLNDWAALLIGLASLVFLWLREGGKKLGRRAT